ncbi:MAG: hypothetical protein JWM47_47 [Acidimicrobiales bacterium]|nr:hypothetical protein [Acidimicrobiales bacterium]
MIPGRHVGAHGEASWIVTSTNTPWFESNSRAFAASVHHNVARASQSATRWLSFTLLNRTSVDSTDQPADSIDSIARSAWGWTSASWTAQCLLTLGWKRSPLSVVHPETRAGAAAAVGIMVSKASPTRRSLCEVCRISARSVLHDVVYPVRAPPTAIRTETPTTRNTTPSTMPPASFDASRTHCAGRPIPCLSANTVPDQPVGRKGLHLSRRRKTARRPSNSSWTLPSASLSPTKIGGPTRRCKVASSTFGSPTVARKAAWTPSIEKGGRRPPTARSPTTRATGPSSASACSTASRPAGVRRASIMSISAGPKSADPRFPWLSISRSGTSQSAANATSADEREPDALRAGGQVARSADHTVGRAGRPWPRGPP